MKSTNKGDDFPVAPLDGRHLPKDARNAQLPDVCRVKLFPIIVETQKSIIVETPMLIIDETWECSSLPCLQVQDGAWNNGDAGK